MAHRITLLAGLCLSVAIAGVLLAAPARAAVIVGGSNLLTTSQANQLEAWLGEGSIAIERIYVKEQGDTSADFHAAVDGKGRTFTLIEVLAGHSARVGALIWAMKGIRTCEV